MKTSMQGERIPFLPASTDIIETGVTACCKLSITHCQLPTVNYLLSTTMPNNFLFDLLGPLYDHVISPKETEALHAPLNLPSDGWLLDIGGGTGRASAGLLDSIDHLVICDLSLPMLQEAKEKGIHNLVQASVTHLPFAADTFNRMMVIDALHHMPNQQESVGQMLRALKPGGRLLIEEPDIHLFGVKLIALVEKLALMKSTIHPPDKIKAMAESHGGKVSLDSDGKGSAWVMVDKQAPGSQN